MNNTEVIKLRDQLEISDEVDESELSDELTSEGPVAPNKVRDAVGTDNMKNSPMRRSFNEIQKEQLSNDCEISCFGGRVIKKYRTFYVKSASHAIKKNGLDYAMPSQKL